MNNMYIDIEITFFVYEYMKHEKVSIKIVFLAIFCFMHIKKLDLKPIGSARR